MRKIMLLGLFVVFCASLVAAQDDYHKFEISGGYSMMRADGILGDGELFSDDPDEELTTSQDILGLFSTSPNLTANPGNLFATSAIVKTGKRHRPRLNGFNASAVYNFSKHLGVKFELSGYYRSSETFVSGTVFTAPSTGVQIIPVQTSYSTNTIRAVIFLPDLLTKTSQQHYNFLGGLQIKNNSKEKRFKPFAHALAGVSRQTVKFKDFTQPFSSLYGGDKVTNTGLTMSFGGGIDIRLSRRFDLRVVQIDYNPVKIKQQQLVAFQQGVSNIGIPNSLSFTNLFTATVFSNNDIRINSRWQNNFRIGVGIVFH